MVNYKKIAAVVLSAALLVVSLPNLKQTNAQSATEGFTEHGSYGAVSNPSVALNNDGSYNISASNAGSFLSVDTYDLTETELSFKFTKISSSGWLHLTLTSGNDIGTIGRTLAYESNPTRIDFIYYPNNKAFCCQWTKSDGNPDMEIYSGTLDFENALHTFGIQEENGHWYPSLNGVLLNNRVWNKLDEFIGYNGGNNLRFGIGAAYGDFSLTSVKAVSKNQAWQTSAAKDCAVDFTDESSELYSAAGNSAFTTTALYDVTANDVEFVMPKKGNDEFLFVGFGVDTADGSVSNRGLIFRESGYGFSGIMNDVNLNGWSYVKDGVFDFTLSANQKHTFGVREKYGSYYPAVDGEILMPSTFDDEMQSVYDDFSNYVKLSNGKVRFVIADFSGSGNTIADVKIVSTAEEPRVTLDKDTFIQHLGYDVGEREAVYKQDDGAYSISAENNGSFLSYSTYDLNNTALSFKFTQISASAGLHLSIARNTDLNSISALLKYEETPTRVDFLIYGGKTLCLQFTDINGEPMQTLYGDIDFKNVTHTFGITKQGDNWYPVIDGNVKNNNVSEKLNSFMNTNGTVVRFGIGVISGDFKVENVKTVTLEKLWETADPDYSYPAKTGEDTYDLSTSNNGNSLMVTSNTYDLSKYDVEFVMPDTGDGAFFVGVGNDFSSASASNYGILLRVSSGLYGILQNFHGADGYNGVYYDNVIKTLGLSEGQKHTLGVRLNTDGYYYPAVDGKILKLNISNTALRKAYISFVTYLTDNIKNNNPLKFAIGGIGSAYSLEEVKIVEADANPIWTENKTTNAASVIHRESNGVYSVKGDVCVSTLRKYDVTKYDVLLDIRPNLLDGAWLYFAISEKGAERNELLTSSSSVEETERIEFIAAVNGDFVSLANSRYNQTDIHDGGFYGQSRNLLDFSIPHTYGLRCKNGHWYLAVDGVILNENVTSERLDDFMTKKGTTEFYFTIGMNIGLEYYAEHLEIIERRKFGDANTDGEINLIDLVRFKKLAADLSTSEKCPTADINRDTVIDSVDGAKLKKILLDGDYSELSEIMYIPKVNKKVVTNMYVKDFGAVGDGVTDDGVAIAAAINALRSCPAGSKLIFEKDKTYFVGGSTKIALNVNSLKDVTIEGDNTTILLDGRDRRAYLMVDLCDNVTVKGFNFDLKVRSHFVGTVVRTFTEDNTGAYIDVQSDRDIGNYDSFDYLAYNSFCFGVCEDEERLTSRDFLMLRSMAALDKGNRIYRIYLDADNGTLGDCRLNANNLSVGERVIMPTPEVGQNEWNSAWVHSSKNCTLKDINIWNSQSYIFSVRNNSGPITFDNVNTVPAPDENVNFNSWRDVYHCKTNSDKIIWKNCKSSGNHDDVINLSSNVMYVSKVYSANEVECVWEETNSSYGNPSPGAIIIVWDTATGKLIGRTTLKEVVDPAANRYIMNDSLEGITSGRNINFTFESDCAPNSEIINCDFEGTIRFHGGPLTVKDTALTVARLWIESIPNLEGPIPNNIRFERCKFKAYNKYPTFLDVFSGHPGKIWKEGDYRLENIEFVNCSGLKKSSFWKQDVNFDPNSPDYITVTPQLS